MGQPGGRVPAPEALRIVQDLANTIDIEMERDTLQRPADLERFAREHAVGDVTFSWRALQDVREFRELLRAACGANAGHDVSANDLAALDARLAKAPLRTTIDASGAACLVPADGLRGVNLLVACVACAIATAQANGTWSRLKACEADNCRWVFYDRSPSDRGRWCTMSICGSRAKMRAYRERRTTAA
jgi:predicted RNA-binding Zn ribbon-like protein